MGKNENPKPSAEVQAMDVCLILSAAAPNGGHLCFLHPKIITCHIWWICFFGRTVKTENEQVTSHSTHKVLANWIYAILKEASEVFSSSGSGTYFILSSVPWHFYALTFLNATWQISSDRQAAFGSVSAWRRACITPHTWLQVLLQPAPCVLCWVNLHASHPRASAKQSLPTGLACWACLGTSCFHKIMSPKGSQWKLLPLCLISHISA